MQNSQLPPLCFAFDFCFPQDAVARLGRAQLILQKALRRIERKGQQSSKHGVVRTLTSNLHSVQKRLNETLPLIEKIEYFEHHRPAELPRITVSELNDLTGPYFDGRLPFVVVPDRGQWSLVSNVRSKLSLETLTNLFPESIVDVYVDNMDEVV